MTEDDFLKALFARLPSPPGRLVIPPGDDCAGYAPGGGKVLLVAVDQIVEKRHYLAEGPAAATPEQVGRKLLARNLSDIAAMGGTPREAFVSLAIPADCPVEFLEELYAGMRALAARHAVNILGGDTTASRSDLFLSVTVVGEVARDQVLYRSGARPGDVICLTGAVGESRAGLRFVQEGRVPADPAMQSLLDAHLLPRPHLDEGRFLAQTGVATAAIDVSDGLSSDLGHVCEESRVGVRVRAEAIPVSPALQDFCRRVGEDPVRFALAGGEDYVLAATLRAGRFDEVAAAFAARFGRPLHRIGQVIAGDGVELVTPDGRRERLRPTGWDHFGTRREPGLSA